VTSYGQFCPVAKAMEVLDERWTLLVVRELLLGSTHFNELRRGVPKMSPALLSKRLRSLERVGVVTRSQQGNRVVYQLTESGRELFPIVESLGQWGLRWIHQLGQEDLDPHLLLWDVSRTMPVEEWPRSRTTLAIEFSDIPRATAHWWLVVSGAEVDVCDSDPGYDVNAMLRTDLMTLTRVWRGETPWSAALRTGAVEVTGPDVVRRSLPRWIGTSMLAQSLSRSLSESLGTG
jgi:DNA-binding HxlR family transcriptional regulator